MKHSGYLNGKWLAQPQSGTQRYATQTVVAALPLIERKLCLVIPADAEVPPWAGDLDVVRSRLRGTMFEQIALPWITRGRQLYSLAGPAPLAKRRQTVVMHDATPLRYSSTFRRSFVLWYSVMYRILARVAQRLLTVSQFSRSELASALGVPEARFEIAPNGADHVTGDVAGDSGLVRSSPFGDEPFVLLVGNMAPHKNTVPAAQALARHGLNVVVAGGSVDKIFRNVETTDSERIRFTGRVSDDELAHLYATATVHVAPSGYEGFGIPVIEAGLLRCPSVFSSGSALAEVAGAGGIEFPRGDFEACASAVGTIVRDPALREKLADLAHANAARFTWGATARTVFAEFVHA